MLLSYYRTQSITEGDAPSMFHCPEKIENKYSSDCSRWDFLSSMISNNTMDGSCAVGSGFLKNRQEETNLSHGSQFT